MGIVSLILTAIIAFLPILIWGYVFSYLDNSPLNARRFAVGIVAGAFSVVPVLYLRDILSFFSLADYDIFSRIAGASGIEIWIAFAVMCVAIALMTWIAALAVFFDTARSGARFFMRSLIVIGTIGIIYALFHSILRALPVLESPLSGGGVTIGGVAFDTLKLVLFYYLIIGVVEESSKHFSMIGSSGDTIESLRKWVLFSIFIALGFGFIENILYIRGISGGIWSAFSTWAFRSIFSLMVHIVCGAIVAHAFSRALLSQDVRMSLMRYARILMAGFLLSIIVHAIFDISLTVGFTGIIFVYFFFGYMGLSRVFYKEN